MGKSVLDKLIELCNKYLETNDAREEEEILKKSRKIVFSSKQDPTSISLSLDAWFSRRIENLSRTLMLLEARLAKKKKELEMMRKRGISDAYATLDAHNLANRYMTLNTTLNMLRSKYNTFVSEILTPGSIESLTKAAAETAESELRKIKKEKARIIQMKERLDNISEEVQSMPLGDVGITGDTGDVDAVIKEIDDVLSIGMLAEKEKEKKKKKDDYV